MKQCGLFVLTIICQFCVVKASPLSSEAIVRMDPMYRACSMPARFDDSSKQSRPAAFRFGLQLRGGMKFRDTEVKNYYVKSAGPSFGAGININFGGGFGLIPQWNYWSCTQTYDNNMMPERKITVEDITVNFYYNLNVAGIILRPMVGVGSAGENYHGLFAVNFGLEALYSFNSETALLLDFRRHYSSGFNVGGNGTNGFQAYFLYVGIEYTFATVASGSRSINDNQ